jgi:hypothetical protein
VTGFLSCESIRFHDIHGGEDKRVLYGRSQRTSNLLRIECYVVVSEGAGAILFRT